ncbi:MAG TPA: sulfotransferase [Chitinophagaceae bacterium]|nr:sulfotransferase [Chitinophagaceae bacterium]
MDFLPNLIIPGAPKAGTSSLCEYIGRHSKVFIPKIKEPRYFIAEEILKLPETDVQKKYLTDYSILSNTQYKKIYADRNVQYRCDASVQYLYYHEKVIPRIKAMLDDPKIIIMLRDPISRAYSNYMYLYYNNKGTFEDEIRAENKRIQDGWSSFTFFVNQGFYYDAVKDYLDSFSKVEIILFDDFQRNPKEEIKKVFNFLEIEQIEIDTTTVYNKSGVPKNEFINWLVFQDNFLKRSTRFLYKKALNSGIRQKLTTNLRSISVKKTKERILPETKEMLKNLYRNDIIKLEGLIKRDLSNWMG